MIEKNLSKEDSETIIEHVESVLISVDEFYDNIFFEIFKYYYFSNENYSQTDIALELDVTQSCVSKLIARIDDYILKVLKMYNVKMKL